MAIPPVSLIVDGRPVRSAQRRLLIHVLRDQGIRVPTLCHDDRLAPYSGCRMCVVERLDGPAGLVPACSTRVQDGMIISTTGEAVIEARRQQLQLIVLNHRMECPVCERNSDCRLQDLVHEIGVPDEVLPFRARPAGRDDSSPMIIRDTARCIVCGRCVRLCEEVQGVAALTFSGRGIETRVATFADRPLDCEFCGQCVNACPVGALIARPYTSSIPVWQRTATRTACSFCACGCELTVEHKDGRLQRVTSRTEGNHNRGKLCVKGWLGLDVTGHPDRLTSPLIRREGALVEAGWEEALAAGADGLRRAAGRGEVVVVGSGRLTCEDGYLLQALAREVLRTPHVDLAPEAGARALVDGVWRVFDRPRSTAGFDDLREADLVLVVGCDPTRSHPLVKTELIQAAVQRQVAVHVVSAVSSGLDRHATSSLRPVPGSTPELLWALTARVPDGADGARPSLDDLPGADRWRRGLAAHTTEAASGATGIGTKQIEALADALAVARRPVVVLATGSGVPGDEVAAARAAASLVARLGAGAGLMVLGARSNTQGLVDVGMHPGLLPGHRGFEHAAELEALTGRATTASPGWSLEDWVSESPDTVAGLLLVGVDPIDCLPGRERPRRALEAAGFTVVVDAFLNHSAERADVVLPTTILSERDGTTVSGDGVRRRLCRALVPPDGVRSDGDILSELALRMGGRLARGAALLDEIERVVGWGWPRPAVGRLPMVPAPRRVTRPSGFFLDAAPQLFHSGSTTTRSALLQTLSPTVAARINPVDARAIGVSRGEVVEVSGGRGEVLLRARLDRTICPGTVGVSWVGSRHGASVLYDTIDDVLSVKVRKA